MLFELLSKFLVALAIGGLIGLEREIYQQKSRRSFAGIRTYLLVAFLGVLSSYLMQLENWQVFSYILMLAIVGLVISAYILAAQKGHIGMTTELSVIVVFLLAMLSSIEEYQKLAVILAVILAVVLSLKEHLHTFAKRTKQVEWFDALTFVFMAFVILPLLPNQDFTIMGIEGAFNPYRTWLMVVFASGVSFIGYFLSKVVGGSYGIGLAGLLGGVVSSTAVTESMANDSKKNPAHVSSYAFGAVIASVVMGIRVIFEVWVIESSLLTIMAIPVVIMSVIGVLLSVRWLGKTELKSKKVDIKLGSPLSLKPALLFGILYSFVVFISNAMMTLNIGSFGFLILGLFAGLVDVDAITLSMSEVFSQGGVSEVLAWSTIIMAVISNTFFKMITAKIFGSLSFFKKVGPALFIMALAGIISVALYLL
jgi:uncharacterized membrane protein (DUF4010 family)